MLHVAGVEAEQDIGFGALHRLLVPLLARLDSLPAPQRRALDATFGHVEGSAPDRFLIGLATLTLLADASVNTPVLAIIDDAQWIDGESKDLLAFIARRLFAERIVLIFAVREPVEGPDTFAGLAQMSIGGLDIVKSATPAGFAPLPPARHDHQSSATRRDPGQPPRPCRVRARHRRRSRFVGRAAGRAAASEPSS